MQLLVLLLKSEGPSHRTCFTVISCILTWATCSVFSCIMGKKLISTIGVEWEDAFSQQNRNVLPWQRFLYVPSSYSFWDDICDSCAVLQSWHLLSVYLHMHSAFTLFLRPPSWSTVLIFSRCDVLCPQHSYSSCNFKNSPPSIFPRSPGDEPATAMLCLPQVCAASSFCQVEHKVATCPSLALPETGSLRSGWPDADFCKSLRNVVVFRVWASQKLILGKQISM